MTTHTQARKRSEAIRQKRHKGIDLRDKRASKAKPRRTKDSKFPPVVARGVQVRTLENERARSKRPSTRRRFDIALGVPGAEIRLPALPHVRIGWRSLSAILVVLLGGLLYTLLNLPLFQVSVPKIAGIQRLTEQEVNTVLNVVGRSIFEVIPDQLEAELSEAFPEFYDISVRVGLPASVKVSLEERVPLLAWEQAGLTVWVDENGVAFPPRGETALELHVLAQDASGPPQTEADGKNVFLDPALINAIQVIGAEIPAGVTLLYDPLHGFGWQDPQGWQVYLGQSGDNIQAKLGVYETVVDHLKQNEVTPALISVAQIDAPFYRLER